MTKSANMTLSIFASEALGDHSFHGHTDGRDWNGWAHPHFTFEVAQLIADCFSESQTAYYDAATDEFVFENEDDEERFGAVEIEGQKLYPIGAGSWIWEEVDQ